MIWSEDEISRVAQAFYADYIANYGPEPTTREERTQHWWAVERVDEATRDGTLPLDLLDALLKAGDEPEAYRAFVAAGPLEDLLVRHGSKYGDEVAARCRVDGVWAEAAQCVWLDRQRWEELPPALQRLVPELAKTQSKARRKRKRPSKRQD